MRAIILILVIVLASCQPTNDMRRNYWDKFDKENHIRPTLDKVEFDSLTSWDLGWFLLEPIDIMKDQEDDEVRVTTMYSPGQKALHFFWYLDAQVTNGGFIQFYLNGYGRYVPAIMEGLRLIDDQKMIDLLQRADNLFLKHKERIEKQQDNIEQDGWGTLYEELTDLGELSGEYFKLHETTMEKLENYARQHVDEFGVLK